MRYLFGFLCVCVLSAVPLPQSASAQDAEEDATSEPNLQEPSSEPAPEEPALQLQLDETGVGVVPSPLRTADGYTLEETDVRVRRAKIGRRDPTDVTENAEVRRAKPRECVRWRPPAGGGRSVSWGELSP